ncbi:MAG: hypothetical protein A2Z99_12860 [Treponema sp. GWB1_62_6]|nr:MAG: hypothetical protein A2Y36_15820 [Treponema sp. GWA1_62_8]OHE63342.1 MAG: hypothetical protein A2Z99_12860 [Treponema sp. GWB1_62_6]OHE63992.1 MAG: hypothetical protein A2001_02860 [Treponema sp. GWC1_61_84]HCM28463.1 hypothetical protein [Treponema sp.]
MLRKTLEGEKGSVPLELLLRSLAEALRGDIRRSAFMDEHPVAILILVRELVPISGIGIVIRHR